MRPTANNTIGKEITRNNLLLLLISLLLTAGFAGVACEGPAGAEGPKGPPGPGTEPSVSGISPRSVFLEHPVDVNISGSGTPWTSGATVDFGEGITVSNVSAASPCRG